MSPRLDLVVGCNGAGKSTLIATQLQPRLPGSPFVNADVIAKERWPDDPQGKSYEAAAIADEQRNDLIDEGRSLIAETVFSHPSKLELITRAQANGYRVIIHAVMIPEDLTVMRVATRVADGGHSVPEQKIRERYRRLWPLVAEAIRRADAAYIYDNSGRTMRIAATVMGGLPTPPTAFPAWTPEPLRSLTNDPTPEPTQP
ncbi:ATPase [Gordonia spumicola]|uniref:UDP-N-acetylglucosamine kinase n=1 Tax=Gordonia spumicola TaxID=589161 RepID=A0A7I9V767_9ACTN|nr:zeta toxin family protein [Gordonia spumicola]GEE01147.1 ATPase [Gordonia spumicola]